MAVLSNDLLLLIQYHCILYAGLRNAGGNVWLILLQVVELDLATVVSSCSGPKRPHDRVAVSEMKSDFDKCLKGKIGFKGYAIKPDKIETKMPFTFEGKEYALSHGEPFVVVYLILIVCLIVYLVVGNDGTFCIMGYNLHYNTIYTSLLIKSIGLKHHLYFYSLALELFLCYSISIR